MSNIDHLVKFIAIEWTTLHGGRYLSHERNVSGWGKHYRDDLLIAIEDGHGRHEARVDTLRATIAVLNKGDRP